MHTRRTEGENVTRQKGKAKSVSVVDIQRNGDWPVPVVAPALDWSCGLNHSRHPFTVSGLPLAVTSNSTEAEVRFGTAVQGTCNCSAPAHPAPVPRASSNRPRTAVRPWLCDPPVQSPCRCIRWRMARQLLHRQPLRRECRESRLRCAPCSLVRLAHACREFRQSSLRLSRH